MFVVVPVSSAVGVSKKYLFRLLLLLAIEKFNFPANFILNTRYHVRCLFDEQTGDIIFRGNINLLDNIDPLKDLCSKLNQNCPQITFK